jgi:MYXO-CTERM domain-containing protein
LNKSFLSTYVKHFFSLLRKTMSSEPRSTPGLPGLSLLGLSLLGRRKKK